MTKSIAIPYALRGGSIVHVSEVDRGYQPECLCIQCGTALVARKGTKKAHHFAHASHVNCSGESVLHSFAKRFLVERIQRSLETRSELSIAWNCERCHDRHNGNLIKKAAKVAMEMNLGDCRPDIVLLTASDTPLAIIEIVVTHAPEANVLAFCRDHNVVLVTWKIGNLGELEELRYGPELHPTAVHLCTRPKCRRCGEPLYFKELRVVESCCWRCDKPIKVALLSLEGLSVSLDLLTNEERMIAARLGVILKVQYSKTQERRYLASTCGACNAFIGEFFRYQYAVEPEGVRQRLSMLCRDCDLEDH